MNRLAVLAVVCAIAAPAGCYRTRYTNLAPPSMPAASTPPIAQSSAPSAWRHFFLFGWVPGELSIDAARQCGGSEHVEAIETKQTFVQGLIEELASYYINIYSPWTGRVVCKQP